MKNADTIKEYVVRELVQATDQVHVVAIGAQRGFTLHFQFGDTEKTLVNSRGAIRLFASLNTAGTFVQRVGIRRFEVDMTDHEPGRLRGARPDRAEALRWARTRVRQQDLEFHYAESSR